MAAALEPPMPQAISRGMQVRSPHLWQRLQISFCLTSVFPSQRLFCLGELRARPRFVLRDSGPC